MLWTHSLVKCPDGYKVIRLTTVRNESETQRNLRFNLFVTTKTKPYQKRFSSRITRLVKTTWKLINFYLRKPAGTVSPMIFFISLAVLKLTSCVPKIADFFLHVLDLGKFSALASTFLAHDDELDKPSFFLSAPQWSPTNQPLLILGPFQTHFPWKGGVN